MSCVQIMRAILHKKMKIHPQSSSAALSSKKYLMNRTVNTPVSANGDDFNDNAENGSKWVKTDSECKFLYVSFVIKLTDSECKFLNVSFAIKITG